MLEIGYNSRFICRVERVSCAVGAPIRVLYLSDLHFTRRSEEMATKLAAAVHGLNPDLVLLGGDYCDTRAGLRHFDTLLRGMSRSCAVLAIAGNHDRFFGLSALKKLMDLHRVQWIDGASQELQLKRTRLRIDGNTAVDAPFAGIRILCLHRPRDLATLHTGYDLAFAGHLHGGQCVLWQNDTGLFPGRLFYRWNLLRTQVGACHYVISRGLGDTLPFRYNCPKELLVVDLQPW